MLPATAFDRYYHAESPVHRLDPRVKVIVALAFILSNLALPDGAWAAFAASWLMMLLVSRLARISLRLLLGRALIALPFALAAITVLFNQPGQALWSATVLGRVVIISDAGVIRFGSIMLRSWLSVQAAVLLTAATPFPDLMHALRHLRVPAILVSIISFMYRYLHVLAAEAERMLRARSARSARSDRDRGGGSLLWRARVTGSMVGQLFLRSYERSERVYQAMLARGYRGQLLTMNPHLMRRSDWLAALLALLAIAALHAAIRLR